MLGKTWNLECYTGLDEIRARAEKKKTSMRLVNTRSPTLCPFDDDTTIPKLAVRSRTQEKDDLIRGHQQHVQPVPARAGGVVCCGLALGPCSLPRKSLGVIMPVSGCTEGAVGWFTRGWTLQQRGRALRGKRGRRCCCCLAKKRRLGCGGGSGSRWGEAPCGSTYRARNHS